MPEIPFVIVRTVQYPDYCGMLEFKIS